MVPHMRLFQLVSLFMIRPVRCSVCLVLILSVERMVFMFSPSPRYHATIRVSYIDGFLHRKVDLPLFDRDFASYADYCRVRDSIEDYCIFVGFDSYNIHSCVVPYDYYRKELAMAKMRYAQSRGVSRRQFKRTAVKTPAVNVAPPKRGGIRL